MSRFADALVKSRRQAQKQERASASARFKEILSIVRKYDLREGITPEVAVSLLQDLGPTFVKLGQIASAHPDILPAEYCNAFAELRANARPLPFADVRAEVEAQLGRPLEEVFSEFDETPLGSASIAQVHKARLRSGGQTVAVKVQRPGIVETVSEDFALLERLVQLNSLVNRGKGALSLKELVEELESTTKDELDFTIEARNLDRFWHNNEGRPGVTSPRCYAECSNEAILVEDFASGPSVGDAKALARLSAGQREALGYLIAGNYMDQVMRDGFYHADPHAGNLLLTFGAGQGQGESGASGPEEKAGGPGAVSPGEEASGPEAVSPEEEAGTEVGSPGAGGPTEGEAAPSAAADTGAATSPEAPALGAPGIEWIDFGMMGQLTSRERDILARLVGALASQDAYALERAVLQVATPVGPVDHGALIDTCDRMMGQFADTDLAGFDMSSLLEGALSSIQDAGFEVAPFLASLVRGLVTLEGTIAQVSDKVDIMQVVTRYVASSFDPSSLKKGLRETAASGMRSASAMVSLPGKASDVLDMLQRGHLKVGMGMEVDPGLVAGLRRPIDRFSLIMAASACVVGACILCLTPLRPIILGVPALSFVLFALGAVLLVCGLVSMRRDEKGK